MLIRPTTCLMLLAGCAVALILPLAQLEMAGRRGGDTDAREGDGDEGNVVLVIDDTLDGLTTGRTNSDTVELAMETSSSPTTGGVVTERKPAISFSRVEERPDVVLFERVCWWKRDNVTTVPSMFDLYFPSLTTTTTTTFSSYQNDSYWYRELLRKGLRYGMRIFSRFNATFSDQAHLDYQSRAMRTGGEIGEGDLFFYFDEPNPAHCLHDVIFSLFAPTMRGRTTPSKSGWKYERYVNAHYPDRACDPNKSWCCMMMRRLGIFDPARAHFRLSPPYEKCFRGLIHPNTCRHRYAIDTSDPRFDRTSTFYSMLDTSPGFYPQFALEEIARRASGGMNYTLLDTVSGSSALIMTVYDRSDTTSRVWSNVNDFLSEMRKRHNERDLVIRVMSGQDEWSKMTPLEQLATVANSRILVSPHGSNIPNAVAMRRGGVVVEVDCLKEGPVSYPTWYDFLNRIGLRRVLVPLAVDFLDWQMNKTTRMCKHRSRGLYVDPLALSDLLSEEIVRMRGIGVRG